ncbi:hypothetical protein [Streptomyces sp. OE57]|uniref:hypothetical protein n=1 Tax=Streptomyces lacaronensis TaxID=3379885 RepID=UPI0039B75748
MIRTAIEAGINIIDTSDGYGDGEGIRVWRCGRRKVAMAMVGPPMIMPMAKAVISRPTWETLTPRSLAISGSGKAL